MTPTKPVAHPEPTVLRELIDAIDSGNLEMNSPEIGGHDGIPLHPWHEEWLHRARAAFSASHSPTTCFECNGPLNGPYCPACNPREATTGVEGDGALTEDAVLALARKHLTAKAVHEITYTAWKDNIDIERASTGLMEFARALSSRSPDGWRADMENAPKDGTRVLILSPVQDSDGDAVHIAYWSNLAARPGWFYRGGWWIEENEALGWQPLPELPVSP